MLLFVVALVFGGRGLGAALFLAGGTYLAAVAAAGDTVAASAPLMAVLLLVSGELAAWSFDERWRIRSEEQLTWRRAAAVGALAAGGLAAATLVICPVGCGAEPRAGLDRCSAQLQRSAPRERESGPTRR